MQSDAVRDFEFDEGRKKGEKSAVWLYKYQRISPGKEKLCKDLDDKDLPNRLPGMTVFTDERSRPRIAVS